MKRSLTWLAATAVVVLSAPIQAGTISNFNANPASGGLSASGGIMSITSIPIDYSFQVPPNTTMANVPPFPPGTVPAALSITSGVISLTSQGGGVYLATNAALSFSILGTSRMATSPPSPYDGANLLSGSLLGTVTVNTVSNSITIQGTGSNWSSSVLYAVGGGGATADKLVGQTFSLSLLGLSSITVGADGLLNFTSINTTPGGSSITGNFGATGTVPEPASLALLGFGLAGLSFVAGRRRRSATRS